MSRQEALPWAQVPHWVMLAPISREAKLLFVLLLMHVDRTDEANRLAWPTRARLASMMGYSKPQSIDPYVDELEKLGAIAVVRGRHPSQPLRKRNYYTVALATDGAPMRPGLMLSVWENRDGLDEPVSAGESGGPLQRTSAVATVEPDPEVRPSGRPEVRPSGPREVPPSGQEVEVVEVEVPEEEEKIFGWRALTVTHYRWMPKIRL